MPFIWFETDEDWEAVADAAAHDAFGAGDVEPETQERLRLALETCRYFPNIFHIRVSLIDGQGEKTLDTMLVAAESEDSALLRFRANYPMEDDSFEETLPYYDDYGNYLPIEELEVSVVDISKLI